MPESKNFLRWQLEEQKKQRANLHVQFQETIEFGSRSHNYKVFEDHLAEADRIKRDIEDIDIQIKITEERLSEMVHDQKPDEGAELY